MFANTIAVVAKSTIRTTIKTTQPTANGRRLFGCSVVSSLSSIHEQHLQKQSTVRNCASNDNRSGAVRTISSYWNHHQSNRILHRHPPMNHHDPSASFINPRFVSSTTVCFQSIRKSNNNVNFSNRFQKKKKPPKLILHRPKAHSKLTHTLLHGRSKANDVDYNGNTVGKIKLFRADRVVSNRTGKSRNESFQLLKDKRITTKMLQNTPTTTNDSNVGDENEYTFETITGPSVKIPMDVSLYIDKKWEIPLPSPLAYVYHKPKWVLSVMNDPHFGRDCIEAPMPGMHPVGRLDYDTSGLLLFSSSGALTQSILHPKYDIEKTYVATVAGIVDNVDELREQLKSGVETSDGVHTAILHGDDDDDDDDANNNTCIQYITSSEDVKDYIANVKQHIPETYYNKTDLKQRGYFQTLDTTTGITDITVTVTEGKYRMVRKILANCNYPVIDLHRMSIGPIVLDEEETPPGTYRPLTKSELQWALSLLNTTGNSSKNKTSSKSSSKSSTAGKNVYENKKNIKQSR